MALAEVHPPVVDATEQGDFSSPFDDEDEFGLEEEFSAASETQLSDPLSGYNRTMTKFNDRIYVWIFKPLAQGYSMVLPEGVRRAVGRMFRNLLVPVRLTNNLLQLKPKQAGTELMRFALNSTIGVLGLGDPAANYFDLQAYPEDFGQTLGYYGVGGGFHLVLPLLGPSNLRDAFGLIPDNFLAPVNHISHFDKRLATGNFERLNQTSLRWQEYDSLKKDAVDLYTFLRNGYEQLRVKEIEE